MTHPTHTAASSGVTSVVWWTELFAGVTTRCLRFETSGWWRSEIVMNCHSYVRSFFLLFAMASTEHSVLHRIVDEMMFGVTKRRVTVPDGRDGRCSQCEGAMFTVPWGVQALPRGGILLVKSLGKCGRSGEER